MMGRCNPRAPSGMLLRRYAPLILSRGRSGTSSSALAVVTRQRLESRPTEAKGTSVRRISRFFRAARRSVALPLLTVGTAQAQPSLTIDTRSRLEIRDEGSPETDFSRLAAVHRFADGRLLTVTSSPGTVQLFDAQGRFVKTVAREGSGPNEIQGALFASVIGRDLWVHDGSNLIRFDLTSSSEAQRIPFPSPATSAVYAVLPAGRILQARFAPPSVFDPSKAERRRDDLGLRVVSARDRAVAADLGTVGGLTFLRIPSQTASNGFRTSVSRLASQLHVALAGGTLWIGDSGTPWLKRIDARTLRRDSIRVPFAPAEWKQAEIAAERARIRREVQPASERELPLAELDPMWRDERPPFYAKLHGDFDGGVWLETFRVDATAPRRVLVLDRSGRTVAQLVLPHNFEVREVGERHVVGVERDADGLRTIVAFPLRRPATQPK